MLTRTNPLETNYHVAGSQRTVLSKSHCYVTLAQFSLIRLAWKATKTEIKMMLNKLVNLMSTTPGSFSISLKHVCHFPTLLFGAAVLFTGPANANDMKDRLVEALYNKNNYHAGMKHDNTMQGNDKLGGKMDHSNMKNGGPGHNPIDVSSWPSKPS